MKIAFFTDTYYPAVDGVVRSIESFKKGLEAKGHEVRVFAPEPKDPGTKVTQTSYCNSIEFPPYPQYRIPLSFSPCLKQAIEFKPDIIHSHAMAVMALGAKKAARKTKAPLVGTFHTMIPQAGHYISNVEGIQLWFENISWKYLQWLYKDGFSKIICPSKYVQKKIGKYRIKSEVLPNPVDVDRFSKKKAMNKKRFSKNTILFLGRIAKEKNLDYLVKLAELEQFDTLDAQIVVAGDGPYRQKLQNKVSAKKLEDKIKFVGKIDENLLSSFYASATCTLFPSLFETQGLSALESLACSTPVVAISKTAISEFIKNGKNGYLVANDPQDAIGAIEKCIKNKNKMQTECRKTATKYSIQKCTDELLKKYKSLL